MFASASHRLLYTPAFLGTTWPSHAHPRFHACSYRWIINVLRSINASLKTLADALQVGLPLFWIDNRPRFSAMTDLGLLGGVDPDYFVHCEQVRRGDLSSPERSEHTSVVQVRDAICSRFLQDMCARVANC